MVHPTPVPEDSLVEPLVKRGHRKGKSRGPEVVGVDDDDGPRSGPNRRCIVSGAILPKAGLLRFVIGPERTVVPDVDGVLPGRGLWLSARRDVLEIALVKKSFSKAARQAVTVSPDLPALVDDFLRDRCLATLGIARRAGLVAAGFDVVKTAAKQGHVRLLLEASDGAEDGRRKVMGAAPEATVITVFSAEQLAAALGRDHVIHVAVSATRASDRALVARLVAQAERWMAYRAEPPVV